MIVTFWLDGERFGQPVNLEEMLDRNDRYMPDAQGKVFVVSERFCVNSNLWHIVLRRPDTPAESTPPWKRKEEG